MKTLKINRSIYSDETVKLAMEAYQHLADICAETGVDYYNLIFRECRYDEDITTKEFENYLIGIENS